jgi:nucleoside-diphosphate-sugar epimerase
MSRSRRRVLVTHADEPLGRRLVKALFHDPRVERVWAVGAGRTPRAFDAFLRAPDERLRYSRVELSRHRDVLALFQSPSFRAARIESLIYLPRHEARGPDEDTRPWARGLSDLTAECRLLLQQCLGSPHLRQCVAVGSAFVYRLRPGNANRLTEESALDLDPAVHPDLRGWIDCDMLLHGEMRDERFAVTLLRVPPVVASGGEVYFNPALSEAAGHLQPLGFDPVWSVLTDKDLVRAVVLALHRRRPGVFNVAGVESLPLSVLARYAGRPGWSVPAPWLRGVSAAAALLGGPRRLDPGDGPHRRFGFHLDTARARAELGFEPGYRVEADRTTDGHWRVETVPA